MIDIDSENGDVKRQRQEIKPNSKGRGGSLSALFDVVRSEF